MSDWVYDHAHHAYYHVESQTYAIIDPISGAWRYLSAHELKRPEPAEQPGWGALMETANTSQRETGKPTENPSTSGGQAATILRLVCRESSVLDPGHIAMLDPGEEGVQVGRDRSEPGAPPRLRIKEMAVSKTHAVFFCDDGQWSLVDLGSTQGTFLNGQRLSEAKSSSKPHALEHLAAIRFGNTTLVAHLHASWPCQDCQLTGDNEIRLDRGQQNDASAAAGPAPTANSMPYAMDSQERRDNRENRRKREMAALRANLLKS